MEITLTCGLFLVFLNNTFIQDTKHKMVQVPKAKYLDPTSRNQEKNHKSGDGLSTRQVNVEFVSAHTSLSAHATYIEKVRLCVSVLMTKRDDS